MIALSKVSLQRECTHKHLVFSDNFAMLVHKCAGRMDSAEMYSSQDKMVNVSHLFFFKPYYFFVETRSGISANPCCACGVMRSFPEGRKECRFPTGHKTNNKGLMTSQFVVWEVR
jgi:hypothetical protein